MSQCNTALDLKINLGHSDLYSTVQWFLFPYYILVLLASSMKASYAVLRQLLFTFPLQGGVVSTTLQDYFINFEPNWLIVGAKTGDPWEKPPDHF